MHAKVVHGKSLEECMIECGIAPLIGQCDAVAYSRAGQRCVIYSAIEYVPITEARINPKTGYGADHTCYVLPRRSAGR